MTVNLSMLAGAGAQFFTNSGVILSGGLVYTYAAGTTTPQAAYTTSSGSTAHTNPIVLDSAGRVPSGGEIWLTDAVAYKFVLQTSLAVLIGTYDNVTGNASGIYAAFAASSGSSLVGFIQAGTGAVATTVQAKLRQSVSIKDFGAVGNGVTNDTAAIQAAIDAINAAGGGTVLVPPGYYVVSATLNTYSFVNIIGLGTRYLYPEQGGSSFKFTSATSGAACISGAIGTVGAEGFAQCSISNIAIELVNSATYGIYFVGASNLEISYCYIHPTNAVNTNRAILFADVISSSVHHNHIVGVKYGLVSNDLFNNNTIYENNFDSLSGGHAIVLRALTTNTGVQSTIRDNNFVNTVGSTCGSALVMQCPSQGIVFKNNTVEGMITFGIETTNTDPISAGVQTGFNVGFQSHGNTFVAQPSYGINAGYCDTAVLGPDVNLSPPVGQTALYLDTNTSVNLSVAQGGYGGGKPVVLISSLQPTSYVNTSKRYKATGNAMVAGTFQLSAGWGSSSVPVVTSNSTDTRWAINFQSLGSGQAANPTITIVFADGTWTTAAFAVVTMNSGTGTLLMPTYTITATQMVITYPGTPVVSQYYGFNCIIIG